VTRYLIGLVVGATGALIGVYCAAALLPATREERRPREMYLGFNVEDISGPILYSDDPYLRYWGNESDDTWTSGPIT
jgi:hypothetical protein